MVDFAALPPEVNSARMYAGTGAGPLTAAAAAWDRLAAELSSAAASYQAVIEELTDETWSGPASAAMTAAVAPYVAWMDTTAAQTAQTANQARAAAAAYEAAFAATVPPAVIAANRASLASLVANNIFGQNTPAIAANQARYAEMWTQDATAMHGYQANSAAAATLTPFRSAPGAQAEPTFQHHVGGWGFNNLTIQEVVQSLLPTFGPIPMPTLPPSNPLSLVLDLFYSPLWQASSAWLAEVGITGSLSVGPMRSAEAILILMAPLMLMPLAFEPYTQVMSAHGMPAGALGSTLVGSESALGARSLAALGGAQTAAGLGRAASVGGLSVPQSWGAVAPATPEVRLAAAELPAVGAAALSELGTAGHGGWMGGMPPVGSVVNAPRTDAPNARYNPRPNVMAAMPGEKGGHDDTPGQRAGDVVPALSDREREELEVLRREVAEITEKRDAAARLVREAVRS